MYKSSSWQERLIQGEGQQITCDDHVRQANAISATYHKSVTLNYPASPDSYPQRIEVQLTNYSILTKLYWEEKALANELYILVQALCKTEFFIGVP